MNDGRSPPSERARQRVLRRALVAVWRSRIAWAVVAALLGTGILGALYVSRLWSGALTECETWDGFDMDMSELIALKRRKETYQGDPDPDAALTMSAEEVNFLLQDMLPWDVRLEFLGDRVRALVVVPAERGCYNVRFEGKARVEDGVAQVWADSLVVGETDLTGYAASFSPLVLAPADLEERVDPAMVRALENAQRVEVEGGRVHIRLFDPYGMW